MLIDSHAHITDKKFDYKQIIADMHKDNLSRIIVVGYNYENSLHGLSIASENEKVFCALGLHPSYAAEFCHTKTESFLEISKDKKVVAIGEIGLDYHYENFCKKQQATACIAQLELAHRAALPIIVHMRDCDEDMRKLLKTHKHLLQHGGVMHCYSGSRESSYEYLDLGFYISFSGTITFKNSVKATDIIKAIPKDRLLIETDCPYLSPEPFRGKLNYPKNVVYVAQKMADILGLSLQEVAKLTTDNTHRIFPKLK